MAAFALGLRCSAACGSGSRRQLLCFMGSSDMMPARPAGRALLHILQHPASELRAPCRRITPAEFKDGSLFPLAEEMLRLMIEHQGAGLAAPQVGSSLQLIVASPCATDDPRHIMVLANPSLVGACAEVPMVGAPGVELGIEGCLSIDQGDLEGEVPRWKEVYCTAQTLEGEHIDIAASGFAARVLQHEIDHLNGVLFIDRLVDPRHKGPQGNIDGDSTSILPPLPTQ